MSLSNLSASAASQVTKNWSSVIISATAAVVVPITTAVHSTFEKSRDMEVQGARMHQEMALQRERTVHQERVSYLAQLQDPSQVRRVLRLAAVTAPDDR